MNIAVTPKTIPKKEALSMLLQKNQAKTILDGCTFRSYSGQFGFGFSLALLLDIANATNYCSSILPINSLKYIPVP